MVARMRETWKDIRDRLPFEAMRSTIEDQYERVPLFNSTSSLTAVLDVRQEKHEEVS